MKINIVKKKASSNWGLGREQLEIGTAATLRELLTELTLAEMRRQEEKKTDPD